MLRWLCINAVVALFSYFGFRANVWKVHIFNGNSEGTINSQGAVFLSSSHNESSRGQNSPNEGGVGCEKAVWGLEGGGWLWFWGHKRRVQLYWTCGRLGFGDSEKCSLLPKKKRKEKKKSLWANSVRDVCRLFQVKSNRAGSEYSQAKWLQVQLHITSRMTVSIVQYSI